MVTEAEILEKIKPVMDPEMGISIVDLGLIYSVDVTKEGVVTVHMTLTTIGCPLFDAIAEPIKANVRELPGVTDVLVDLTFDPPWSPEKMSEEAKILLGFG